MARPIASAVPEGASRLARWWISETSASQSGPSARAASRTKPSIRFTPSEKFAATTTGATFASAAIAASSSAARPVVPITAARRTSAATTATARVAAGVVKST